MAFFTINICDQVINSPFCEDSRCRVAVHTALGQFASSDVTEFFQITSRGFSAVSDGHAEAFAGIATDAMFDSLCLSIISAIQRQDGASIVA